MTFKQFMNKYLFQQVGGNDDRKTYSLAQLCDNMTKKSGEPTRIRIEWDDKNYIDFSPADMENSEASEHYDDEEEA